MRLAFITPTAYLQQFSRQGDFYLALAHLVDDDATNEYASFHRREAAQGKRVILDNGLFEGAQVSTEQLLRRASSLGAQVVCAPDVLYDSKGTIKAFKQFIRDKQEFGLVADVMGIPQATNQSEWWDCWQFMQGNEDCHMVGLSILSVPKSFPVVSELRNQPITGARVNLIRQLYALSYVSGTRLKPMHLLGLGESYADIKDAKRLLSRDIVSNDSSSCFVHGYNDIRYRDDCTWDGGKILEKLDFNIKPSTQPGPNWSQHVQHNINTAKEIAHD